MSSPSGITVGGESRSDGGDVRGPRAGEIRAFVGAFAAELEGRGGEGEDMVSARVVLRVVLGGAYSPGGPARPRSPSTLVVRRGHG